jgi:hypothetical protein
MPTTDEPSKREDGRIRLKQWLEEGNARLHAPSFSQRELWEASPVPVEDPSNHICTFMEVKGILSPRNCTAAVQKVVDRQEVLRLSFLPGRTGPLQMLRNTGTPAMELRELSSAERHPEAIEERLQAVFREPFDLLKGPLYRVDAMWRDRDDLLLAFVIHHAIADGWTLGVWIQDLCRAYVHHLSRFPGGLRQVPQSYTAWAAAEREEWTPARLEQHARYWRARLAGTPRLWSPSAGAKTRTLIRRVTQIPADIADTVKKVARRSDATLFSTLLTAFQIAISQWTGQTDIVVGTPVANRTKRTVRETMGYCSGVVPLRSEVDANRPFGESVREVHQMVVDSFANAMPFVELAHALGDAPTPDHNPIFDIRFALQNHPIPDITLPGLSVKLHMRSTGTARFDLGCEITEAGRALEVVWLHRPELFDAADVDEIEGLFRAVLEGLGHPSRKGGAVMAA